MREGEYGRHRVPVVSHALDIPARLKELDEGYYVMLNTATQRFEIWWGGQLECVLPYEALDERTIRHVREHRMERLAELEAEVEAHNRRLEEAARRRWLNDAEERTREALRYLRNNSKTDEIPKELMER